MSKFIGDVSAYAYAVSKGYTGTEEEFAELMASYADVGQTAVDAKDAAVAAKTAAQTAATTATNKAAEATTAAQTATTKAGEASTSASTATSAKDTAVSASQTATTKATEATTAAATAVSAKDDAVSANTAAQSAKTAAQTAQTGAETAAASVSASAAQIQTNADDISELKEDLSDTNVDLLKAFPVDTASGAIASFTDGAELPLKSLTVDIEPIQDLHGYDHPWPAGGGKNLLPSIDATFTDSGVTWTLNSDGSVKLEGTAISNSVYDFGRNVLTLPAGTYTTYDQTVSGLYSVTIFKIVNGTASAIKSGGGAFTLTEATSVFVRYVVPSGTTVNTTIYPQLEAGSTATTYAPYSNICPISGHTQAVVTRTGKNLFDKSAVLTGMWLSTTTGLEEANGSYCVSDYIPVKSGETVYIPGSGTARRWFYDRYKNPVTYLNNSSNQAFAPLADGYIRVTIAVSGSDAKDLNTYQIEYGSTATAYEPYSGQSININLGQTVYGGTLDVVSGELVIDRAMVDLGTLTWEYSTSRALFTSGSIKTVVGRGTNIVCSMYKITDTVRETSLASLDKVIGCNKSPTLTTGNFATGTIIAKDTAYTDATAFKTAVTGQTLVYELATPLTVQLTPHEVTALLGSNNVWADSGDSTVEYRADPTLYISRLTEPDADMVADSNITSGSYFMVGNTLYKATANIASGATISPNVNCTRKSLSEALNELNA